MAEAARASDPGGSWRAVGEVMRVFLKLGLTSFGGPIAHLGYFRSEFVARRGWLSESAFADLVALAQFLPGPASSQVGFAIGLTRAGGLGGLAAWAGFTLPSAALMLAFAYGAAGIENLWWGAGLMHGLKLMAVAVIAQAVLGMARSFCVDPPRAAIAVVALALVGFFPGSLAQLAAIVGGGFVGLATVRLAASAAPDELAERLSHRTALIALALFLALLALSYVPVGTGLAALAAAFYRSGALVFGGGHVVLPLLRDALVAPGFLPQSAFLAAYGAAQALPGPLFAVSAGLGALAGSPPSGGVGAAVGLIAIFVPGLLALIAALPFWRALRRQARAQSAMAGINAAVVGLLAAALYDPAFVSAVNGPRDLAVAAAGFALLVAWRTPPLVVAAFAAAAGVALAA